MAGCVGPIIESEGNADTSDTSDTSGDGDGDGDGDGSFCGDGVVDDDEECDDGNPVNTDACLDTCQLATCGDGFTWVDNEECDDGNEADTDACPTSCQSATCGDGIVWEGEEPCDDGNEADTDACLTGCQPASCGDGVVWEGEEQCDDGDEDDDDACPTTCQSATCGDGVIWEGEEQCDDGDEDPGDGCAGDCVIELYFTCEDGDCQPRSPPRACRTCAGVTVVAGESMDSYADHTRLDPAISRVTRLHGEASWCSLLRVCVMPIFSSRSRQRNRASGVQPHTMTNLTKTLLIGLFALPTLLVPGIAKAEWMICWGGIAYTAPSLDTEADDWQAAGGCYGAWAIEYSVQTNSDGFPEGTVIQKTEDQEEVEAMASTFVCEVSDSDGSDESCIDGSSIEFEEDLSLDEWVALVEAGGPVTTK